MLVTAGERFNYNQELDEKLFREKGRRADSRHGQAHGEADRQHVLGQRGPWRIQRKAVQGHDPRIRPLRGETASNEATSIKNIVN